MANLPFSSPSPWKGSAGWSAPNVPVLGSFYPLLCSRWRMAAVPPCHGRVPRGIRAAGGASTWLCVAAGAQLGLQGWALPGSLGTRAGMFRCSCQGCAPACHHRGLRAPMSRPTAKDLAWFPEPRLLCPPHPTSQKTSSAEIHFALSPARSFFYFSLVRTAQKHQAAGLPGAPKEAPGAP